MSRSLTVVRQMWQHGGHTKDETVLIVQDRYDGRTFGKAQPVLIVPYNPTARLAMIRRTVKTLWPRAKGKTRERREAQVMFILGTALTPQ